MRKYEPPQPTSRHDAEQVFRTGTTEEICETLVALALHEDDAAWVESICLEFTRHPSPNVRAIAATCLGHLARIHGQLNLGLVLPSLQRLLQDPSTSGYAENALSDIEIFMGGEHQPRR